MFDYISILAGGRCPENCPFCVGKAIRNDVDPHYGKNCHKFLKDYKNKVKEFSLSGSSSDPLFCPTIETLLILDHAQTLGYKTSLHTKVINKLWRMRKALNDLDEICISIHDKDNIDFINKIISYFKRHHVKIRISSVYWSGNANILSDMTFYNSINTKFFTIRKNIFEPDLKINLPFTKQISTIFEQPVFTGNDKYIALWDFKKANNHIKALYLWPDNTINEQCFWYTLHPSYCI